MKLCSPGGSFRSSIDQGFLRDYSTVMLMKKLPKLPRVSFCLASKCDIGRSRLRGQVRVPKPECAVCDLAECEQIRINREAAGGNQAIGFARIESEFDNRTCNVPGHVLAADQIMRLVVINSIRFQHSTVAQAQPLVTVQLVVGADPVHARSEEIRIELTETARVIRSECQRDVVPRHA